MFQSHFFLSPSYSTVQWTFIFFCLKFDTILPFAQTPSFFLINLFYRLINSHFILSQSYSTVGSNPIFFCHDSILPFAPLPLFSVSILFYHSSFFLLNLLLFYHSHKPHLFFVINLFYYLINSHFILSGSYSTVRWNPIFFCQNSIQPFVLLPFFSVSNLFYRLLNIHILLS